METLRESIEHAAAWLASSRNAVCLTGAGVSAESGIPTFRDEGGIWDRYPPDEYATLAAFVRDPAKVWPFLLELGETVARANPNPAHHAIAELARLGVITAVVTQNIDGLHQRAGSPCVLELHGSSARCVCMSCARRTPASEVDPSTLPPRCACGGVLKPDVVMFGEMLPAGVFEDARGRVRDADVLLVVGTSSVVYPAAALAPQARQRGARIVEVNPDPGLDAGDVDCLVRARAGEALPLIAGRVAQLRSSAKATGGGRSTT